ncbi:hypothetical protein CKM354_001020100 [Cercospora kikuchii]|uniref:RNA helicase n=1 Tax=Cercospora kikuchii TaxID=84275 RepID=A0A9P3FH24_9PEZI|nr:uncharacterized protein CKM354_001020100 [Cercospora kikuchii]GIZ47101.1 hypothetical protein CKM354_001020100 [Cercospora kikuchii]
MAAAIAAAASDEGGTADGKWPSFTDKAIRARLVDLKYLKPSKVQEHILSTGGFHHGVNSMRLQAVSPIYSAGRTTGALVSLADSVIRDLRNGRLPFTNPTSTTAEEGRPAPHMPYALIIVHAREPTRTIAATLSALLDGQEVSIGSLHADTDFLGEYTTCDICVATPSGLTQAVNKGHISGAQLKYVYLDDADELLGSKKFESRLKTGLWRLTCEAKQLHDVHMSFMICFVGRPRQTLVENVSRNMKPIALLPQVVVCDGSKALIRTRYHFDWVPRDENLCDTLQRFFAQWLELNPGSARNKKHLVTYAATKDSVDLIAEELINFLAKDSHDEEHAKTLVAKTYGIAVSETQEGEYCEDHGMGNFQNPNHECNILVSTYVSHYRSFTQPDICCLELPTTTPPEQQIAKVHKWFRAVSIAGLGEKYGEVWTMLRPWLPKAEGRSRREGMDDKTMVGKIVEEMEKSEIPVPQDLIQKPERLPAETLLPPSHSFVWPPPPDTSTSGQMFEFTSAVITKRPRAFKFTFPAVVNPSGPKACTEPASAGVRGAAAALQTLPGDGTVELRSHKLKSLASRSVGRPRNPFAADPKYQEQMACAKREQKLRQSNNGRGSKW